MQLLRLLGPAALVALASAQYLDDDQFDILAREEEAPGYDDLGFFIRDVDHNDIFDLLDIREADAEPEELLFAEETGITLSAREADQYGEFDSLTVLKERDAEADAEADPLAEPKKKKSKKGKKRKGKKNRKHKKKGKKGKKSKKGKKGKGKKKQSKAAKRKAAKIAKEDEALWA